MARQSLDSLLGNTVIDTEPATPPATKVAAAGDKPEPTKSQPARAKSPQATRVSVPKTTQVTAEPKYLTLIRKEARIREEQYANLTEKSRQLNRSKTGGERITENTLIRIAIDLLWSRAEDLQGVDEAALRKSVGL